MYYKIMKEIIGAVVAIIVVAAVAFIGVGLVEKTNNAVGSTLTNTTVLDKFHNNISNTFDILGSMLPIVVLALIGGLAIFYILSYLGNRE
jgi:ABC-type multidrug transport system permease subunit